MSWAWVGCAHDSAPAVAQAPAASPAAPTASSGAASLPRPEPVDGRLPPVARPKRQSVLLRIDPSSERFSGEVTLEVELDKPSPGLWLHGRGLSVSKASLRTAEGESEATVAQAKATADEPEPELLWVASPRLLPAGTTTVTLRYEAAFDRSLRGLYRVDEGGASYAFTQLEPSDARRVFPCLDEPGYKAPFSVTVEVPSGQTAFSNAAEVGREPIEGGKLVRIRFAETRPLPSYLVAVAAGPLEVLEGPREPVPVRVIATRGRASKGKLAAEAASKLLAHHAAFFGVPYAYGKLDLVAVPEFSAGAMENPGLVTFRDDLLLVDEQRATARDRQRTSLVLSHELAHQWFGDLVTAAWWDDLWLNEGFATWAESRAVDAVFPSLGAGSDAAVGRLGVMESDVLPSAKAVRQPIRTTGDAMAAFDGLTYEKGAAVLRMLEAELGPEPFRKGVSAYVKAHADGNATASDLFASLSQASGKDVTALASPFLDRPGVPQVSVDLRCEKGSPPVVSLRQQPASSGPGKGRDELWPVPVCVAYGEGARRAEACTLLEKASGELVLPDGTCPSWLYPDAGERGYYRGALADRHLEALARAGLAPLTPVERAGLLRGLWARVQAGEAGAGALIAVLEAARGHLDRPTLEAAAWVLLSLERDAIDEADRRALERLGRRVLGPALERSAWGPDALAERDCRGCTEGESDERALGRPALLEAAGLLGDASLERSARQRAEAFLAGKPEVSVDNGRLALRLAARRGDEKLFDKLAQLASSASASPQDKLSALRALGSFADPALLRRALDLTLTDKIKLQDAGRVVDTALSRRSSQAVASAWLRDRFEQAKARLPDWLLARLATGAISAACAPAARDERIAFFEPRVKDIEGVSRDLALAKDESSKCIAVRARLAPELHAALGKKGKR